MIAYAVLATALRARGVPARLAAIVGVASIGTFLSRLPAPAVRVDLGAAGYPSVLVGVLAPVLIGILAAAPAPTRLGWLTAVRSGRAVTLVLAELVLVTAVVVAAAGLCGMPAGSTAAAVQNALLTQVITTAVAAIAGAAVASVAVGSAAVLVLLASPGLPPAWWLLVDTAGEVADWWAAVVLAPVAVLASVARPDRP